MLTAALAALFSNSCPPWEREIGTCENEQHRGRERERAEVTLALSQGWQLVARVGDTHNAAAAATGVALRARAAASSFLFSDSWIEIQTVRLAEPLFFLLRRARAACTDAEGGGGVLYLWSRGRRDFSLGARAQSNGSWRIARSADRAHTRGREFVMIYERWIKLTNWVLIAEEKVMCRRGYIYIFAALMPAYTRLVVADIRACTWFIRFIGLFNDAWHGSICIIRACQSDRSMGCAKAVIVECHDCNYMTNYGISRKSNR